LPAEIDHYRQSFVRQPDICRVFILSNLTARSRIAASTRELIGKDCFNGVESLTAATQSEFLTLYVVIAIEY